MKLHVYLGSFGVQRWSTHQIKCNLKPKETVFGITMIHLKSILSFFSSPTNCFSQAKHVPSVGLRLHERFGDPNQERHCQTQRQWQFPGTSTWEKKKNKFRPGIAGGSWCKEGGESGRLRREQALFWQLILMFGECWMNRLFQFQLMTDFLGLELLGQPTLISWLRIRFDMQLLENWRVEQVSPLSGEMALSQCVDI